MPLPVSPFSLRPQSHCSRPCHRVSHLLHLPRNFQSLPRGHLRPPPLSWPWHGPAAAAARVQGGSQAGENSVRCIPTLPYLPSLPLPSPPLIYPLAPHSPLLLPLHYSPIPSPTLPFPPVHEWYVLESSCLSVCPDTALHYPSHGRSFTA